MTPGFGTWMTRRMKLLWKQEILWEECLGGGNQGCILTYKV